MPCNFAADSFHAKKLCCRLSLSEVRFLVKIGRFAFFNPPPPWGLRCNVELVSLQTADILKICCECRTTFAVNAEFYCHNVLH